MMTIPICYYERSYYRRTWDSLGATEYWLLSFVWYEFYKTLVCRYINIHLRFNIFFSGVLLLVFWKLNLFIQQYSVFDSCQVRETVLIGIWVEIRPIGHPLMSLIRVFYNKRNQFGYIVPCSIALLWEFFPPHHFIIKCSQRGVNVLHIHLQKKNSRSKARNA